MDNIISFQKYNRQYEVIRSLKSFSITFLSQIFVWTDSSSFEKIRNFDQNLIVKHIDRFIRIILSNQILRHMQGQKQSFYIRDTGRIINYRRVQSKKNKVSLMSYVLCLNLVNQEVLSETNRTLNIGAKSDLLRYEVSRKGYSAS